MNLRADHGGRVLKEGRDYTVEFHDTPQLWVAYFCGCSECPKSFGRTKEEAVAALEEFSAFRATPHEGRTE